MSTKLILWLAVALDGCSYDDTGANMEFRSVLNSANVNIIFLEFILDDVDFNSVNPEDRNKLFFSVMPAEQDSVFDDYDYDGLLGATFLQFCEVNFREGYIECTKTTIVARSLAPCLLTLKRNTKHTERNKRRINYKSLLYYGYRN